MNPEAIISEFAKYQSSLGITEGTIGWQKFLLTRFFAYARRKGVKKLTDIDQKFMVEYQVYVASLKNKKGNPYAPAVRSKHIAVAGKVFQYLRLTGKVFENPVANLERIKVPKQLPRDILSAAEMVTLLEQPDTSTWLGVRDKAILEVLYSTAIRRNELVKLDMNDLHFDRQTIHIREGKYGKDRVVPCGKIAWKWLKQYIDEIRPHRIADPDEEAVFISNKSGGRLGKQGIKMLVDGYSQKAGFNKKVTPHTFRHSCATHMSDNGADITRIQELLGHASLDTTAKYVRVSIVRLKRAHGECHPREISLKNTANP